MGGKIRERNEIYYDNGRKCDMIKGGKRGRTGETEG